MKLNLRGALLEATIDCNGNMVSHYMVYWSMGTVPNFTLCIGVICILISVL